MSVADDDADARRAAGHFRQVLLTRYNGQFIGQTIRQTAMPNELLRSSHYLHNGARVAEN